MNYDFFAQHPVNSGQDAAQLDSNMDSYSRILLFSQALLSPDKEKIRQQHYKSEFNKLVSPSTKNLMASLGVDTPNQLDLTCLPFGSFFISFQFQLVRPYISGDDEPLYIIDNPVAKEKVFKMPMVRSTGWKGALRSAIRLKKGWGDQDNHPDLLRLFGMINDNGVSGKTGCLYFYPSFFDAVDLEIINPHDRKKKAGKQPIYFESVPVADTTATFTLLYTPLDRIGQAVGETRQQIFADLQLVAAGLEALFTVYGFGAKTSSGFGLADITGKGHFNANYPDKVDRPTKPTLPAEPDSIGQIRTNYPNEDFSLKPKAWRKKHGATNNEKTLYTNARADWNEYQKQLGTYEQQLATWEGIQKAPPPAITKRVFTSFEELQTLIEALRKIWQEQGGDA